MASPAKQVTVVELILGVLVMFVDVDVDVRVLEVLVVLLCSLPPADPPFSINTALRDIL